MINSIAEMFEDNYLKIFSECIQEIGVAESKAVVDNAVVKALQVLKNVKDQEAKSAAEQRLRLLADMAYQRISR